MHHLYESFYKNTWNPGITKVRSLKIVLRINASCHVQCCCTGRWRCYGRRAWRGWPPPLPAASSAMPTQPWCPSRPCPTPLCLSPPTHQVSPFMQATPCPNTRILPLHTIVLNSSVMRVCHCGCCLCPGIACQLPHIWTSSSCSGCVEPFPQGLVPLFLQPWSRSRSAHHAFTQAYPCSASSPPPFKPLFCTLCWSLSSN